MGARESFTEVQRGKIVGYKYDEPLLNEWLSQWAWYTGHDRGVRGFGQSTPGMSAGAGSKVASEEDIGHLYDDADAERSGVITVIVYEELSLAQRIAIESTFLVAVYRIRNMTETLAQGKEAIAKALIRRGYPLGST